MDNQIITNVLQADRLGASILRSLSMVPNASNYEAERERFFADAKYHPQFQYATKRNPGVEDRISQLQRLTEITNLGSYHNYFEHLSDYCQQVYQLNLLTGQLEYSQQIRKLYDWDLSKVSDYSKCLNTRLTPSNEPRISPNEIELEFQRTLSSYKLSDWTTEQTDRRAGGVRVYPGGKKVIVGSNAHRTPSNVKRLISHEIETHVLRTVNGKMQKLEIVSLIGLKDYILIEEGLAVFSEYKSGYLDEETWQTYAARIEGVKMNHKSLRELYVYYLELFDQAKAFEMAYRLKRGVGDSRQPGGSIKDAAYIMGFEIVKNYIENGGDVKYLYSGKVSLNESIFLEDNLINMDNLLLPKWVGQND